MSATVSLGVLAGHFGRDVARCVSKVVRILEAARGDGVDLVVFPHATLGGYLEDLRHPSPDGLPPLVDPDGPEFTRIRDAARETTVCLGFTEEGNGTRYNTAVCLTGDGILGTHRKVHQPVDEGEFYSPGDEFRVIDTPVGRLGMVIDYDKTFPESTRSLALDGAVVIAALSAWPASVTDRASRLPSDRQSRLFDLYDCARAAENQVFVVSSHQTGTMGAHRFLGQAKVVGPGGEILASTRSKGGFATVRVDVTAEIGRARRTLSHLTERRPETYSSTPATTLSIPGRP